jgi:hypothetical protein
MKQMLDRAESLIVQAAEENPDMGPVPSALGDSRS